MKTLKGKIKGKSPIMLHNAELANPANPYSKELKKYTGKRKKTDADQEKIHDLEWIGGVYLTDDGKDICIPPHVIRGFIIAGARRDRNGKPFESALQVMKNGKFIHDGPKDLETLRKDPKFRDIRIVRVQQQRVPRCRAKFDNWSVEFEISYDEKLLNKETVVLALNAAGATCGVGDALKLGFGRFEVVKIS